MLMHAQVLMGSSPKGTLTRSFSPQLVTIHKQRLCLTDLRPLATWGPSAVSPGFGGDRMFLRVSPGVQITLQCFSQKQ